MKLLRKLISEIYDGEMLDIVIGYQWTTVDVERENGITCGLLSTLAIGQS